MKSGYDLTIVAIVPDPTGVPKTSYGNAIPITGTSRYTLEKLNISIWRDDDPNNKSYRTIYSNDKGLFDFVLLPPDDFGTKPGNYTVMVKDVEGKTATARWIVTGMLIQLQKENPYAHLACLFNQDE
jgi:hypothetical protein